MLNKNVKFIDTPNTTKVPAPCPSFAPRWTLPGATNRKAPLRISPSPEHTPPKFVSLKTNTWPTLARYITPPSLFKPYSIFPPKMFASKIIQNYLTSLVRNRSPTDKIITVWGNII